MAFRSFLKFKGKLSSLQGRILNVQFLQNTPSLNFTRRAILDEESPVAAFHSTVALFLYIPNMYYLGEKILKFLETVLSILKTMAQKQEWMIHNHPNTEAIQILDDNKAMRRHYITRAKKNKKITKNFLLTTR